MHTVLFTSSGSVTRLADENAQTEKVSGGDITGRNDRCPPPSPPRPFVQTASAVLEFTKRVHAKSAEEIGKTRLNPLKVLTNVIDRTSTLVANVVADVETG